MSIAIMSTAINSTQSQYSEDVIPVLSVADRARTVNAKGEYVDHRWVDQRHYPHTRHNPPFPSGLVPRGRATRDILPTLPRRLKWMLSRLLSVDVAALCAMLNRAWGRLLSARDLTQLANRQSKHYKYKN